MDKCYVTWSVEEWLKAYPALKESLPIECYECAVVYSELKPFIEGRFAGLECSGCGCEVDGNTNIFTHRNKVDGKHLYDLLNKIKPK